MVYPTIGARIERVRGDEGVNVTFHLRGEGLGEELELYFEGSTDSGSLVINRADLHRALALLDQEAER